MLHELVAILLGLLLILGAWRALELLGRKMSSPQKRPGRKKPPCWLSRRQVRTRRRYGRPW